MTVEPSSEAAQRGYSVTDCCAAALACVAVVVTGLLLNVLGSTLVLTIIATSALSMRRVYPGPSAVVAALAVLSAWVLLVTDPGSDRFDPPFQWGVYVGGALLLTGTYSAVAWADRRVAAAALVVALGSAGLAAVLLTGITWSLKLFAFLAVAVLAWTTGQWRRSQRRYLRSVQERARLAEAHRERDIAMAVASERAHIAREMHDVISHSLAVMIAQADGARFVLRHSPDDAARALAAIGETGRGAAQDMAGLLGALRDDGPAFADRSDDHRTPEPRSPQPGLSDLAALVEHFDAAGLPTTLTTRGTPAPVSAGLELTVFRVVQEALTNVLKHAGRGTPVAVRVTWHAAELLVNVANGPPGRPDGGARTGSGRGLVGMRERVAHLGGTVEAGRHSDGGYHVRVSLPLDPIRTRPESIPT
ncbi:MAG TPA: histidine kinase [Amycolatopsis sp.]|jgi:signal transduction histidine kinase|nr:histidine kinase [Amycolatopsis sp.]